MKDSVKITSLLFLALCLVLILADGNLVGTESFHTHVQQHRDLSGNSNHFEHSHSVVIEYVAFRTYSGTHSILFPNGEEYNTDLNPSLVTNFITCIWQPPKFS